MQSLSIPCEYIVSTCALRQMPVSDRPNSAAKSPSCTCCANGRHFRAWRRGSRAPRAQNMFTFKGHAPIIQKVSGSHAPRHHATPLAQTLLITHLIAVCHRLMTTTVRSSSCFPKPPFAFTTAPPRPPPGCATAGPRASPRPRRSRAAPALSPARRPPGCPAAGPWAGRRGAARRGRRPRSPS